MIRFASLFSLAALIALLFSGAVFSMERKAVLSCSPSSVEIGDSVNLILEVSVPDGETVTPDDSFDASDLEITGKKRPVYSSRNGVSTSVYQFEAIVWSVGKKSIGPVKVSLPSGAVIESNVVSLEVKSVLGENDAEINDIKKNADVALPPLFWILLLAGIALLAALVILVVRLVRNRGGKGAVDVVLTPEEEAENALKRLSEGGLFEKGMVKEYYSALAEILKKYIDVRYDLSALDSTTAELYRLLRDDSGLKEHSLALKELLSKCDMVKFACFLPDTSKEDLEAAKDIYGKIRVAPEEEEKK